MAFQSYVFLFIFLNKKVEHILLQQKLQEHSKC